MDEYSEGYRPYSSFHKKDPRSLVNANPEFGGNERPGYPSNFSADPNNRDSSDWKNTHGGLPGESVLMDDGGDSSDGVKDNFTATGEFNTDDDRMPMKEKILDNMAVGPHNMQSGNVFNRVRNKVKHRGIRL